jgi:hypothetical protein
MTGHHLEVLPVSGERWVIRYEGDPTPLGQHRTLDDALADARTFARSFGEPLIHVHERDGFCHTVEVEPEFRAPTPADVKGPHVEP